MSPHDSQSAPTKASLLKWWKSFTNKTTGGSSSSHATKSNETRQTPVASTSKYQPSGRGLARGNTGEGRVFGVSPQVSLKYASVAISMIGPDGKPSVYGYVPIVVAKCGMMLKERATQTEGIFRVSGSNKRINQLQELFDQPPRYGKDLDWTGYTVHDAASVLRRYLNMMPEPVIPADLYLDFTAVLQQSRSEAESIAAYQKLIKLLPPTSRYLLLYLLDFLSVFVRCSAANLMTASNLAVVFQPGLVSTRQETTGGAGLLGFPGFGPDGKRQPPSSVAGAQAIAGAGEHGRGKEVLEFLIEQQSNFMIGLEIPTQEEVVGKGEPAVLPLSKSNKSNKGKHREAAAEDSGYGQSGSSPSSGGLAADLHRRGSEKSVERRRLRKTQDPTNGKVKRSRTLPGNHGGRINKPNDTTTPSTPETTPAVDSGPKWIRKSKRGNSPNPSVNPQTSSAGGSPTTIYTAASERGARFESPKLGT